MEITHKNAFYITIKCTIHPLLPVYTTVTELFQQNICIMIGIMLQKPIHTTIIALLVLIFLMMILTISFIFMAGITFLVLLLILLESIILTISLLSIINTSTVVVLALMISHLLKNKI